MDSHRHIVRHTGRICRILGMLISIIKAISRNHFLIGQTHCPGLYVSVIPLHTPRLVDGFDFLTQSPVTIPFRAHHFSVF